MIDNYSIFVEGVADERLISQLVEVTFDTSVEKGRFIATNGWKALLSPAAEMTYINQMRYTTDNGGINLVIFDADDDFEKRQQELVVHYLRHFPLYKLPQNPTIASYLSNSFIMNEEDIKTSSNS